MVRAFFVQPIECGSEPTHIQSMMGSDSIRTEALDSCFDALSSREPASTSLENAIVHLPMTQCIVRSHDGEPSMGAYAVKSANSGCLRK